MRHRGAMSRANRQRVWCTCAVGGEGGVGGRAATKRCGTDNTVRCG